MLAFLGVALKEARDTQDPRISLRDIDFLGRRRGGTGHDPGKLSRIERGEMKRWPADIDDIVRAYAEACDTSDTALWARALELYGAEEGRAATRRARRNAQRRATPRRREDS